MTVPVYCTMRNKRKIKVAQCTGYSINLINKGNQRLLSYFFQNHVKETESHITIKATERNLPESSNLLLTSQSLV